MKSESRRFSAPDTRHPGYTLPPLATPSLTHSHLVSGHQWTSEDSTSTSTAGTTDDGSRQDPSTGLFVGSLTGGYGTPTTASYQTAMGQNRSSGSYNAAQYASGGSAYPTNGAFGGHLLHGYQPPVVAPSPGLHVGQSHYGLPSAFGHDIYPNTTQAIAQYCDNYVGYH